MRLTTITPAAPPTLSTCPICMDDVASLRTVNGERMCQPCAEVEVDEIERAEAARAAFSPTAGAHCARCGATTGLATWRDVVYCVDHATDEANADFLAGLDDGFSDHDAAHRAGAF